MTREQRRSFSNTLREFLNLSPDERRVRAQQLMLEEERRKRAERSQQLEINDYAWELFKAVKAYQFPAVTYDFGQEDYERVIHHPGNVNNRFKYIFKSGREIRHRDMSELETLIKSQLLSSNSQEVKYGLSNVLYWGFGGDQKGIRPYRVGVFWMRVTEDHIDEFKSIASTCVAPDQYVALE